MSLIFSVSLVVHFLVTFVFLAFFVKLGGFGGEYVEFIVNGNKENLDQPIQLLDYLKGKGLQPEMVVIEYNGQIIPREEWSNLILKENDHLEILRFVGGGS